MESSTVLSNPVTAHEQIARIWQSIKPELIAGRRHVVEIRPYEDSLTDKQRAYYHGYILTEIANQARIDGKAFPMLAWKEHYGEAVAEKVKSMINARMKGEKK